MEERAPATRAFAFDGNWREYAPIAFTNLLLTIVTLGVYTFWARTRTRQYLWSRTRFIDDRLEWTGTGLELLIGYVLAIFLFILPVGVIQFLLQALALRGQEGLAALLGFVMVIAINYLAGVAIFRGLRYRLSRTFWHGIRGGSDEQGLRYGVAHLWKSIVGGMVFGLLIPWSMVSLWNQRWQAMSFGPFRFESNATHGPLMARFLLAYLVPLLVFAGVFGTAMVMMQKSMAIMTPEEVQFRFIAIAAIFYFGFFVLLGIAALLFYAAYFRQVVSHLSLGELDFEFTARTRHWLGLILGNFALVIFTLGIGSVFLGYRHWAFFIRHLQAYGTLNLDDFTQSETRAPGQGEGLLDAFDVGAI
jgi:uncharacterized membrane protein YjgN (DUF898 family)